MIPGTISLEITYSRSRQNPILKISNFPANSGKVRYRNEKVPSVAIAHRPAREMAIFGTNIVTRTISRNVSTRCELRQLKLKLDVVEKNGNRD